MSQATKKRESQSTSAKKRSRKRAALIEFAAVQMNRRGAASVNPAVIGAEAGISRNTVYYYFRDRQAMTVACYDDALRHLEEACTAAEACSESAVGKLMAFVRSALSERAHFVAVMSDLDLTGEDAARLRRQRNACIARLEHVVEHGVANGDLRPVPHALAARVLVGMVEWKRLWCAFMRYPSTELVAGADDICHWLLGGLLDAPSQLLTTAPTLDSVLDHSVDVMDPIAVSQQKRKHLLGAASSLFNRRGIDATTIDDIARSLGTTKGFVYHYVEDKEHLVRMCYDRAFDIYERVWEASREYGRGTSASLQVAMNLNTQVQLSSFPPLTVQAGLGQLPAVYRRRSYAIWRNFVADVKEAVKAGEARPGGDRFVDFSAGAFFWLGNQNPPEFSVDTIPADVTEMFFLGLGAT